MRTAELFRCQQIPEQIELNLFHELVGMRQDLEVSREIHGMHVPRFITSTVAVDEHTGTLLVLHS